jgi:hypothetical protein
MEARELPFERFQSQLAFRVPLLEPSLLNASRIHIDLGRIGVRLIVVPRPALSACHGTILGEMSLRLARNGAARARSIGTVVEPQDPQFPRSPLWWGELNNRSRRLPEQGSPEGRPRRDLA